MLRKILLPTIFILLSWGFWVSPDFKMIVAGISIFLFGMLSLEDGFKSFTGGALEKILRSSTDKMWKSLLFGFTICTLMQSSGLVSLITISFLGAGLIGLIEGIGIVFGANIGTTTGAWLIAGFGLKIHIAAYAMPMLAFGVLLIFQKSKSLKGLGYILTGLGFLLLGIHYMKEGFETISTHISLTDYAMEGFSGILVFALIGVIVTVIMQSSHATLLLLLTALSVHQITYENALALTIGANLGSTITAVVGSLTSNVIGRRLALSDVIFKIIAGSLFIVFLHPIINLVDIISSVSGIAEDNYTLKLAVFHSLFNISGVIIMVPLINHLVRWITMIIPDKEITKISKIQPLYLNDAAAEFPDTAMEAVRNETLHIWDNAIDILSMAFGFSREEALQENDLYKIAETQKQFNAHDIESLYEQNIRCLYEEVILFINKAGFSWEMDQSDDIHWLRESNQNITNAINISILMQKNLATYAMSSNQEMKEAYTKIRVELTLLIRKLETIRLETDVDDTVFSLDYLNLIYDEHISEMNRWLAICIKNESITALMAASLMNDVSNATNIHRNLVEMAEMLFVKHYHSMSDAERSIQLNEDDLNEIKEQMKNSQD